MIHDKIQAERYTLYLADCMDVLPTLENVDAVVTDPPYGIEGGKGGDSRDFSKGVYSGQFEDSPAYIKDICCPAIHICLDLADAVAVTPGIRCLGLYPTPRDMGCFWTPAACTHGPWGMTTFQPILYYGKDWRAGKGAMPSGRKMTEPAEKNGHPCPKPIAAWTWLVDKVVMPTGVALDPFMGSGTTGVACMKLGRKFIGIEIDPAYFAIAHKRIAKAAEEPLLFKIAREAEQSIFNFQE